MDKKTHGHDNPHDNPLFKRLRPELVTAEPVFHGGPDIGGFLRRSVDPGSFLDFSTCLNPFPPPKQVLEALHAGKIDTYPDSKATLLVDLLSEINNRHREEIICVNGLSQAIFLIAFSLIKKGDPVMVIGPTYGEYEKNSRLMGAKVRTFTLSEKNGFIPVIEDLEQEIQKTAPKVVWLCNPNNPTGVIWDSEDLEKVKHACRKKQSFLIIDEAYMNFTEHRKRGTVAGENIITMRSMTKDFSIPGLRLGYVMAHKQVVSALRKAQPEWSLNAMALAAGTAALGALHEYGSQWERVRALTLELAEGIRGIGYTLFPPEANYILFRDDIRGGIRIDRFRHILGEARILVRDCTSFGLHGYIRVGTSTPPNNAALVDNLSRSELWNTNH